MALVIDAETKSKADLFKVGAWAYSQHPSTDVICLSWGAEDEPTQTWWPGITEAEASFSNVGLVTCSKGGLMPTRIYMAVCEGEDIEAHNVSFEYSIWWNVLCKKYKWIEPHDHCWHDTMAVACYYSLPAKLANLLRALGMEGKNNEGNRLITKYSKLNLKTSSEVIPPEDFSLWVTYCEEDVEREKDVSRFLGQLPKEEHEVFLLDLLINSRGLLLDLEGIEAAAEIVDQRSKELNARFREITGLNVGQVSKLLRWFKYRGLELENMQKDYIAEVIEKLGQGELREALEIRLKASKASTKKLDAMLRQRDKKGRARFQFRYHGANTGRHTGSGFQPLNLVRSFEDVPPEELIKAIMHKDAKFLDLLYGDAMNAVSKASRHFIQAPPGSKIIAGDFVSIEAVILACLAREQWKIDAFARGEKIYELMGDKIYRLPAGTVTKETHPQERFDGKTGELAFGYQGALNAWLNFDSSGRHTDERIIEICKAWRAEHPSIVAFWADLEDAAKDAMMHPDEGIQWAGDSPIGFEMVEYWLTMVLPNGKRLWYWNPEIRPGRPHWHKPLTEEACMNDICNCGYTNQISYMSQKSGQWKRVFTYGGKFSENATQATSREALVPAMKRVEAAGYIIILPVYDEIVCEVPEDFGSAEELVELMEVSPGTWAADWPITADAWEGARYKK